MRPWWNATLCDIPSAWSLISKVLISCFPEWKWLIFALLKTGNVCLMGHITWMHESWEWTNSQHHQRRSQNAETNTHIKGRLLDQAMILFSFVPFQIGTSLKGKNLLPQGANSFLFEQFLIVWKVNIITLSDLPWMLLSLLPTCVICVMGATPMHHSPISCVLSYITYEKNGHYYQVFLFILSFCSFFLSFCLSFFLFLPIRLDL